MNGLNLTPADEPTDEAALEAALNERGIGPDQGPAGWLPEPEAPPPQITEPEVRRWLEGAGAGLHFLLPGRTYGLEDAWRFTDQDVDELAPPLTRIVNRHPRLAALAARGDVDAVMVAWAAVRYAGRNIKNVAAAREAEEAARPHLPLHDEAPGPGPAGPHWPGLDGQPTG